MVIRAALGARRIALLRQLLVESLVLGVVGRLESASSSRSRSCGA
jgi:hypothetical protein